MSLRLTPFARRWGAGLVAGAIVLGVGAGYGLVPPLPPLTVRQMAAPKAAMGTVLGMAAPTARRTPLKTPFTAAHEGRTPPLGRVAPPQRLPLKRTAPARLVGFAAAGEDSRAILLWEGRQVVLAPGESAGALTLLSVAEEGAWVRAAGEERLLRLPAPSGQVASLLPHRHEGRG